MPPAHRRQLRPTGAERLGLTKQKQDRRHLARRRIAQPVSVSSLQAGVGRHRQAERLRHLLRRRQLRRHGEPLRHERQPRARV